MRSADAIEMVAGCFRVLGEPLPVRILEELREQREGTDEGGKTIYIHVLERVT